MMNGDPGEEFLALTAFVAALAAIIWFCGWVAPKLGLLF